MGQNGVYRIPSEDSLVAFETVVRLGGFSHAAEELGISPTSVCLLVAKLENRLSRRLLRPSRIGIIPTCAGRRLYDAVAAGLEIIETAAVEAGASTLEDQVVVLACSQAAYRFFVMPRYDTLSEALGTEGSIHVVSDRNHVAGTPAAPDPDVILTWESGLGSQDHVVILEEAIRPVCSPDYADSHGRAARGPVSGWGGLTLIHPPRPSQGLASWEDWFRAVGRPDPPPRFIECESYAHALDAAAAGEGIALGWRHLIGRHLETGMLVALGDSYIEFDNRYCAALDPQGTAAVACAQVHVVLRAVRLAPHLIEPPDPAELAGDAAEGVPESRRIVVVEEYVVARPVALAGAFAQGVGECPRRVPGGQRRDHEYLGFGGLDGRADGRPRIPQIGVLAFRVVDPALGILPVGEQHDRLAHVLGLVQRMGVVAPDVPPCGREETLCPQKAQPGIGPSARRRQSGDLTDDL